MKRSLKRCWSVVSVVSCLCAYVSSAGPASAKNFFDLFSAKHSLKDTDAVPATPANDNVVSSEILINAPVDVVWKTVHLERDCAPNLVSNNLLQADDNHSVFEQKWCIVPFISKTTCVMDEQDYPTERIDFKLLKSDEFKRMEGSWLFSPADDGKSTTLKLTAHLELRGMGSKAVLNAVAKKKMEKRLAHVKELAEQPRAEMKVNGSLL